MSAPELAPIPYAAFLADVRALADAIEADGWRPAFLVGIGRGGLVPATFLSHATGVPLLSVDHSAGEAAFAADLLVRLAERSRTGARLLLVDDINDSGRTLAEVRGAILAAGGDPAALRTAVLLDNRRSTLRPDYAARPIDRATDRRWFVFPWEQVAPHATLVAESEAVPERLAGPTAESVADL